MFDFHFGLGLADGWEHGVWALGALIGIASVLAVLEDFLQRIWKSEAGIVPQNSVENFEVRIVERIVSPKQTYELREHITAGDLCDIYRASAGDSEYLLKITRVPNGQALMAKEFSILNRLQSQSGQEIYQRFFPKPVESVSHNSQHMNVYDWCEGFYSAEQVLDRHHRGLDGRHLGWMFNRMLEALGYVHRQGWIHGAVLPPHVMFHADSHGLLLVGWIHAEKENTSIKIVPEQFKDWYPPECRKKLPATPSVDIYLAAKTLISLAGGDPVLNLFPEHVPVKIQRFVKGCLLESPSMRAQNAWEVRQEFGHILEGLYGPPAFHPLDMS